jgi:hypothetical protein
MHCHLSVQPSISVLPPSAYSHRLPSPVSRLTQFHGYTADLIPRIQVVTLKGNPVTVLSIAAAAVAPAPGGGVVTGHALLSPAVSVSPFHSPGPSPGGQQSPAVSNASPAKQQPQQVWHVHGLVKVHMGLCMDLIVKVHMGLTILGVYCITISCWWLYMWGPFLGTPADFVSEKRFCLQASTSLLTFLTLTHTTRSVSRQIGD